MKISSAFVVLSCMSFAACKTNQFRSETETLPKTETTPKSTAKAPVATETGTVTINTIDTSVSELQLNQSCDRPVQLLSSTVKLSFPGDPARVCKFNEAPNLEPKNAFVQAREITTAMLKLPENSEICSMTLDSAAGQTLRYDDFIVLTIDDFVLFSSNVLLTEKLAKMGNYFRWDFGKVVGEPIGMRFKDPAYCVGAAERCVFPGTESVGPVSMKLNYTEISGITKAIQGKAAVPVDLITTGDDNLTKDCLHTTLDLAVTMTYIKKAAP